MTPEEIQQMKPGRELDKLVFKFVMGGRIPEPPLRARIMNFSTDISAAWEVVEHLKNKGAEINIGFYEKWDCDIDYPIGCNWREVGETAPEAICKAALLAVLGEAGA